MRRTLTLTVLVVVVHQVVEHLSSLSCTVRLNKWRSPFDIIGQAEKGESARLSGRCGVPGVDMWMDVAIQKGNDGCVSCAVHLARRNTPIP